MINNTKFTEHKLQCNYCRSKNIKLYVKRGRRIEKTRKTYICCSCRNKFVVEVQPKERKTYPQKWALYNKYQVNEKMLFLKILSNAVDSLGIEYEWSGDCRPPFPLADMLKSIVIKVFNGFSTRRSIYDLKIAHALGYIKVIPHFNTISKYMNDERLTPLLHRLYMELAKPLAEVEEAFAVDATGFGVNMRSRWVELSINHKSINRNDWKDFAKLQIFIGIKTNIIAAARPMDWNEGESPHFIELLKKASFNFKIREVTGDKAYLSKANCDAVIAAGGFPYIVPRRDSNTLARGSSGWHKMMLYWRNHREEFLQHYHLRSNVESTFSAMKRKFLPYIRSKKKVARDNEMLCKVVCQNISALIEAIFGLGVETEFMN